MCQPNHKKKQGGFTLIELLVVIAIIGILSSVVLASLSSARKKARVARTIADMRQIYQTIQFYFNDTGIPPPHDHNWSDNCEKAMFISGIFSPKPAGWNGPYIASWPKNQWGYAYHWERSPPYSISIQNISADEAQMVDNQVDDGNLATGLIRSGGGRLEYFYGGFDFPDTDNHTTSCTP